jgi:two-component system sensor histidine kinase UhpB
MTEQGPPGVRTAAPPRATGDGVPPGDVGQWLARELHDSVVQSLTTLLVEMELLKREQEGHHAVCERIDAFETTIRAVLFSLRLTLYQLRDEPIRDDRFRHWLGRAAADLEARCGAAVRVRVRNWPRELSVLASYNLSRIVDEALRNVVRHSRATHVSITLAGGGSNLRLTIRDDGIGCSSIGGVIEAGLGMRGMAERAAILGGEMAVTSSPGRGTTVRLSVPRARVT